MWEWPPPRGTNNTNTGLIRYAVTFMAECVDHCDLAISPCRKHAGAGRGERALTPFCCPDSIRYVFGSDACGPSRSFGGWIDTEPESPPPKREGQQ